VISAASDSISCLASLPSLDCRKSWLMWIDGLALSPLSPKRAAYSSCNARSKVFSSIQIVVFVHHVVGELQQVSQLSFLGGILLLVGKLGKIYCCQELEGIRFLIL